MNIPDQVEAIEQRIASIEASIFPLHTADTLSPANAFEQIRDAIEASSEPISLATIQRVIIEKSARWNVDPNLVKAIIQSESGFHGNATSPLGAQGLMQLMPETAASLGVTAPYDPEQNIAGGARYLRSLLDRFHGNTRLAVAAYNAGPNAVERYNGVPPYKETENYVATVLANFRRYTRNIAVTSL